MGYSLPWFKKKAALTSLTSDPTMFLIMAMYNVNWQPLFGRTH